MSNKAIYFSIHDICNLKIVNPPEKARDFFNEEYKFFKKDYLKKVDLVVAFNKKIPLSQNALVIPFDCILDKNKFYRLDEGLNKGQIPFSELYESLLLGKSKNKPLILNFESDFAYNLVFEIVELILKTMAVKREKVFIHASSFSINGNGIIVSAFPNTGKTHLLLRALNEGCDYLAEDFVIFDSKGNLYCYPRRIKLEDYLVKMYPSATKKVNIKSKIKFFMVSTIKSLIKPLIKIRMIRNFIILGSRLYSVSEKTQAEKLFKVKTPISVKLNSAFILFSSNSNNLVTKKSDFKDFTNKLNLTMINERRNLIPLQQSYNFLSSDQSNFLKLLEEKEQKILKKGLKSVRLYDISLSKDPDFGKVFKLISREINKK